MILQTTSHRLLAGKPLEMNEKTEHDGTRGAQRYKGHGGFRH